MTQYMLAVHSGNGARREPMTPEEMQASWATISAIEEDLKSSGAWVFSAKLHDPDTATVVRATGGRTLTTDGPYVESKEHLGGFYIINADDLDGALNWAARVSAAINMPIEVRPFAQTAS